MNNNLRKGPIRQFSLNNLAETPTRRKTLKKQFSEDIPDTKEKWIPELGFHVSLCTKSQIKALDRPPPAKLAWIENRQQEPLDDTHNNSRNEEGIIAKKCKEIRRPATAKITRQSSLNNKDSILLSHQELAERLRQAWKDREKGKQNLNIFLAHNVKEKPDEDFNNDLTDSECTFNNDNAFDKTAIKPKIILPLKPEMAAGNEINYKNIFQKRMRRAHSIEEPLRDSAYSPTRTLETKSRTVVVVPLVENSKQKEVKQESFKNDVVDNIEETRQFLKIKEEEKPIKSSLSEVIEEEQDKPIDVIIRPMTAAAKREGFRSRTNSAFHGSGTKENQRPPLVRASSVPLKPSPPKPKFVPVKRRVKSAPKRKEKSEKTIHDVSEIYHGAENNESKEETEEGKSKGKKFQRCVSVSGAEIITMVSLVSPEESETEEQAETEKEKPKAKPAETTVQAAPAAVEKPIQKLEHQKNFTLRKAVKSVTFQQSSIHAVRSFSASFPARRGSVATALMLNNSLGKAASGMQEKRSTAESLPNDDVREPKRRLVRTKSAPSERSIDDDKGDENSKSTENPTSQSKDQTKTAHNCTLQNSNDNHSSSCKSDENDSNPEDNPDDAEPVFDTPKEKQCWETYCKLSQKGVNISFDTILRGMLTPTEYRLRRKSVSSNAESNAESNVQNNTDNAADS